MTTTYSEARRQFKTLLDRACDDHEPVRITRRSGKDAVLVSADDYSSLEETAFLLRTPANARRLLDALERSKSGEPGIELEAALHQVGLEGEEP